MRVTSLFDLRQQLAVYLLPLLGGCEILYSMPTVRRPLAAGVTTLVLNDHSVKRSEDTLPGSRPLLLEVGLRLTALHRDSMEAVETLTDAIPRSRPCSIPSFLILLASYSSTCPPITDFTPSLTF